jgi:STE24 endopeptidase
VNGSRTRDARHRRAGVPDPRRPALIGAAVLAVLLVTLVVVATPWQVLPSPLGGRVPIDVSRDFTAAEHARENAYHRGLWPAYLASMAAALLAAVVLGFTAAGARLVRAVARPFGGGRGWQFVLGTTAVLLVARLASLPFDIWMERLQRRYGLTTRDWGAYAVDVTKQFGLTAGAMLLGLAVFWLLVWWFPRLWWAVGAVVGAGLVVVASYVYPLVVEPAFNSFAQMPAGDLRTSLFDLAKRDNVDVSEVLVADASKRTSKINAYVSGIGSSRRIVIYDTTMRRLPSEQIRMIIAHELGHVKRNDVLVGTAEGALGMAIGVCVIFVALASPAVRRRAGLGPSPPAGIGRVPVDPASVALVLGLVTALVTLTTPVQLLVSRRIEARADVHSLDLARDPATMAAMQRRISLSNLGELDPDPLVYALIATHPVGPERIALARTWARLHGVPEPPNLVAPAADPAAPAIPAAPVPHPTPTLPVPPAGPSAASTPLPTPTPKPKPKPTPKPTPKKATPKKTAAAKPTP